MIYSFVQESRELKKSFDEVTKLYNDKLEEQRRFRERTQRANETLTNLKLSLVTKLSDIESKFNCSSILHSSNLVLFPWGFTKYFTKITSSWNWIFCNVAGYFVGRKELNDVIEKLRILDEKVHNKFCQIALDSIALGQCANKGDDTKVKLEDIPEGFCSRLKGTWIWSLV